ncbi:MAG: hypothetical protein AAGC72_10635 [Planctomycetota bacterium]
MNKKLPPLIGLYCLGCFVLGCQTPSAPLADEEPIFKGETEDSEAGRQVTVVIALSSIVPGGVVGHAGIAVDDAYWDYGPTRTKLAQPIKSIRSEAGPWWDDPDQRWQADRTLHEVLCEMPDQVHPTGSLVAIVRASVTDEEAERIAAFWRDTYDRMRNGEDTYRLTARQCASMVGWSLQAGLENEVKVGDRLPRELHGMTPTKLYEKLREGLKHTAGPDQGQPADITLWQLQTNGLTAWHRPDTYEKLAMPELPRLRIAVERIKQLPQVLVCANKSR